MVNGLLICRGGMVSIRRGRDGDATLKMDLPIHELFSLTGH
jgi:hypothetical protein